MFSKITTSALAILFAGLVDARAAPPGDGNVAACHSQSCDNCGIFASANAGYPNCIIYPSNGNLDGYDSSSGNGYDVWWNSGDPNPGCKIIVRTPASTDLPACGYFLRDWSVGGCYYTAIQESFMLQYCCGTGDCNAAEPSKFKRSIGEVHADHLQGLTSSTAIKLEGMLEAVEGIVDLGDVGEILWRKREPLAGSLKATEAKVARDIEEVAKASNEVAKAQTEAVIAAAGVNETGLEKRCDDSFDLSSQYTKGGVQSRVSPTQNCNVPGGCAIEISSSVETGYEVSFSVGVNIGVFESSLSVSFHKSTTHSLSFTFNQEQGTTGYVSFIPTFDCYSGNYHSCDEGDSQGDICNPRLIGSGSDAQQDGTYSFVYT